MKFSAVLALAAGVSAGSNAVSYVTETVTAVTTFCPEPTEVTYGDITYTVTEPTTLTITDCNPCTIHRPVTTISSVVCSTSCPSPSPKPPQVNSTIPVVPPTKTPIGTISPPSPTDARPPIETAGAGRTAALSGGALAGLLGLAAFVL